MCKQRMEWSEIAGPIVAILLIVSVVGLLAAGKWMQHQENMMDKQMMLKGCEVKR